MREHGVDDAGPVEAGDDGDAAAHGRGLVAAGLLHPADVELEVGSLRGQRAQAVAAAPGQVLAKLGLGVNPGLALEPGEVGRDRASERVRFVRQRNRDQNVLVGAHLRA